MVHVNKQVLAWYVMTVKLGETFVSGIRRPSGLPELPKRPQKQLQKQQQTPSDSLPIEIKDDGEKCEAQKETSPEYEWVVSIKEKLDQASQDDAAGSWAKLSIYKVPRNLREGDDKAYVPQMVSLGPYHRGKKRLRQMERHKWRSLDHVLKRPNQHLQIYLDSMKELEVKARACYEGPISLSINEFVEMMVLDGCFVLELFQGAYLGFRQLGYLENDPVFAMRGSMHSIQRDMMMLENQLPLFILDRLMGLQSGNPDEKGLVSKLALAFFDPLTPTDVPSTELDHNILMSSPGHAKTFDPSSDQGEVHCLDVFRRSLLRSGPQEQGSHTNHAKTFDPSSDQGELHCLDVFRKSLLRPGPQEQGSHTNHAKTSSDQGELHCLDAFQRNLLQSGPQEQGSHTNHAKTFDPSSDQGEVHCLDVFRRSLLRSRPQEQGSHTNHAKTFDPSSDQGELHRLEVSQTRILQSGPQEQGSHTNRVAYERRQQLIHCVTELRAAGIKFKKIETDRFWNIKFENGILRIPRLFIHDGTKSLFLNLIAFEQCHLDCSNDITSYVIFMDHLINSPEDVGYLHSCGIIEHWLGSDAEVADLFNRLCQEVVFDINHSYLSQLSRDVNQYCKYKWNTWRASLKHNYFNNPWAIISLVAAVVLLLLTFIQTFYAVYGYYRPVS